MRCNLITYNARFGIINVQIRYVDLYHSRRLSRSRWWAQTGESELALSGDRGERPPREETRLGNKRDRYRDDRGKSITYGPGSSPKDSVKELPPVVVEPDNNRRTDKDSEEVNSDQRMGPGLMAQTQGRGLDRFSPIGPLTTWVDTSAAPDIYSSKRVAGLLKGQVALNVHV